jgi:hypothetical protein
MINGKQKIKLHQVLDLCIDITNNTEYAAHFQYCAHVKAFSVSIHKKSDKTYKAIYTQHAVTFDAWNEKLLKQTQLDLANFINKKEVNA